VRLLASILLALVTFAQGPPPPPPAPYGQQPRDVANRPEPTGTAAIRGRVVTGDSGSPVRRAQVTLTSFQDLPPLTRSTATPPPQPLRRSMMTGPQGTFEFTKLPAGNYRVMVSAPQYAPQYLGMAYGGKRASSPFALDLGEPIQLTDGQVFENTTIALPRAGVIVGRLTDENGEPLARVQVYSLFYPPGATRGQRNGSGAQTDDLGQFRLFGLAPGEYAVVAEPREMMVMGSPPGTQQNTDDDRSGFLTTYYPGSPDEAGAMRVRTRAGAETGGIEFRIASGRMYQVSGIVMDSQGQPISRAQVMVGRRVQGRGMSMSGSGTDPQGQFTVRNLTPGDYRFVVRQRPMGPPGPDGAPPDLGEMADVAVSLGDADITGLVLTTAPGTTVTGQVVFEQPPPAGQAKGIRVMAGPADLSGGFFGPQPSATVQDDLTFTLKNMFGELLLRVNLPQQGWFVRSVTAGGDDITETGHRFASKDRVTITVSTRASTLEGTVSDEKGQPVKECSIVMFGDDKATWTQSSMWTKRAGCSQTSGRFRIMGLRPGRYLILAAPRERLQTFEPPNADYFQGLAKDAMSIVVNEDEQRTIDLKLTATAGGGS
jgi:protocatechuate 3,4-dioxygenase beta subunit